jgi:GH24 family phage-related lysozyme (muramidase)
MNTLYTEKLPSAIEQAEGFNPNLYLDSRGFTHIGIGHRLAFVVETFIISTGFKPPITHDQALTLLTSDLRDAAHTVAILFPNCIVPSVRTDVLVELAFILGGGKAGLPSWRKLIKAVRADRPIEATWQILDSRAYWQIPERLLTLALRYLTRRY